MYWPQVLGKHRELLGTVKYAAATHRPIHSAVNQVQLQQQHKADWSAAQSNHGCSSIDSSIGTVTKQRVESGRHEQQLHQPLKQSMAAGKASLASQDSTALSAYGGSAIPAEWHAVASQQEAHHRHSVESDETAGSSHGHLEDRDADSLISSSSGWLQLHPCCCSVLCCHCAAVLAHVECECRPKQSYPA